MTSVVAQEPSSGKLLRKKERKAVSAIDVSNIARTASAEARSDQDEIREFIAAKNSPEAMTLNSPCHSSLISQSSFKRTNTAGSTSPVGINSSFKSVTSQSGSTRTASSGSSFKNVFSSFRNSFRTNMRKSFEGSVSESMILRASKFELDEHDLKVKEKIGEGCSCDVFAGEWKPQARKVAIKKLRGNYNTDAPQEKRSALVTELEVLSMDLDHPNIVEFIGVSFYQDAHVLVLVFEHMAGGNLEHYFESRSKPKKVHQVPLLQALHWSMQLFDALTFLHGKNPPIIHRDIKPVNLMLSADFKTLKLRDFGLSKTIDRGTLILPARGKQNEISSDASKIRQTTGHRYTGTARYMAPECNKNATDYTEKADIYSSALVMWFMLEGERPWEKHHGQVAFTLAKTGNRPSLDSSRYPEALARLISRCWAADASSRPSADVVLRELQRMDDMVGRSVGCWLGLPSRSGR